MVKMLITMLLGGMAVSSTAANFQPPNAPGDQAVGFRVVRQYDTARVFRQKIDLTSGVAATGERARPVQTLIWYPANRGTGKRLRYGDYLRTSATETDFARSPAAVELALATALEENYPNLKADQLHVETTQAMLAARDAAPAPGKFPVLIYAPGSSSSAHENADLCEYLASHGYIVLASASVGMNTRSIDLDLEGAQAQAGDISFLAGYAATLPQADATKIAVAGYSFGGLANVLAAARDDRIGALVALDGSVRYFPAIAQAASYATPERLALPMLYLGGKPSTAETMNKTGQIPTYSLLNEMKYADLYNVTMYTMEHAAFQSESLRMGPEQRFGEYSRAEATLAYGWMERYVLAFLDAYLKNNAQSMAFVKGTPKGNGVPDHLLAVDIHQAEGAPPTLTTLATQFGKRRHSGLAAIYGDMHKAAPAFKPAERALISWGEPFLEEKRYAGALEIYQLVNVLYPDSPRAAFYLAMAYEKNRDTARAIEQYRRVLGFWPDMAEAKLAIARLRISAVN
jgi:dienelactone hydrolase